MIIIGYQGIGKSTTVKNYKGLIDLESSNFFVKNSEDKLVRPDKWETMYVNTAIDLHMQGYHVFTSSHKCIRDEFVKRCITHNCTIICPSLYMKDRWLSKLEMRYYDSGLIKDFKAWNNAVECYDENIKDLISERTRGFNVFEIDVPDYKLDKILVDVVGIKSLNLFV